MAWVTIPPTATDPDAPLTSFLAKAWSDNPAAIANGDAGAPRITNSSLMAPVAGTAYTVARAVTVSPPSGTSATGKPASLPIKGGTVTFSITKSGGTGEVRLLINGSISESIASNGTFSFNKSLPYDAVVSYYAGGTTGSSVTGVFSITSGNDAPIQKVS